MLAIFFDVYGWTHDQWLAACILVFIVVAVILVLVRSAKILRLSRGEHYQPNLRPLRRGRRRL